MLHTILLVGHIAAGTLGLAVAPVAMLVPKRSRRHSRLGLAYQATLAVLTLTTFGLVALAPTRLWGLGLVAVATEAVALAGWRERLRHRAGWLARHVRLMCGSYVSLVTAALVVNWDNLLAWVLPTVIGTPLIALAVRRSRRTAAPGYVLSSYKGWLSADSWPHPRTVRQESVLGAGHLDERDDAGLAGRTTAG